jgi:hypothetical protein
MQYKSFNTVFTRTSTGLYLDPSKVSSFYRFVKKDLELKTPSICIIPPWDVQSIYMMSLETRGSEHITTHHILTVWTADNLIHFDIEDAPRMDVSNVKMTRHHIPDDKCLKIHQHKKCVAIFMFSAGAKIVYDSRYMLGSPFNLITDLILIYTVPCILLHIQRFITYSWSVILFCILVKQDKHITIQDKHINFSCVASF